MARAKRTVRAEARRRYRAATTTQEAGPELAPVADVPAAALPRDSRRNVAPPRAKAAPPVRPGLLTSLRMAAGPIDFRGDLRALPQLALHSKAFVLPVAAILVTGILVLIPGMSANPIVVLAASLVLPVSGQPPMIVAFLGGMFAPRAAWLVGGLVSLLAALVYGFILLVNPTISVTPLGWTYEMTESIKLAFIVQTASISTVFGLAVGAFAGFYRRFLSMAAPPSQQQARGGGRRR